MDWHLPAGLVGILVNPSFVSNYLGESPPAGESAFGPIVNRGGVAIFCIEFDKNQCVASVFASAGSGNRPHEFTYARWGAIHGSQDFANL